MTFSSPLVCNLMQELARDQAHPKCLPVCLYSSPFFMECKQDIRSISSRSCIVLQKTLGFVLATLTDATSHWNWNFEPFFQAFKCISILLNYAPSFCDVQRNRRYGAIRFVRFHLNLQSLKGHSSISSSSRTVQAPFVKNYGWIYL